MVKEALTVQYKGIADDTNGNIWVIPTGNKGTLLAEDSKGKERAMRYCANQASIWIYQQNEFAKLESLYLMNGFMTVQAENKKLINFLDIHPLNGVKFEKIDLKANAEKKLVNEEIVIQIKAELLAKSKQKNGEVMLGSLLVVKSKNFDADKVSYLSGPEIRAALYDLAMKSPEKFTNTDMTKVTCLTDPSFLKLDLLLRAYSAGIISTNLAGSKVMWGNGEPLQEVTTGVEWKTYMVDYFGTEEGTKVMNTIATEME